MSSKPLAFAVPPAVMKIISVHFPKAGGSSMRIQLERLAGQNLLLDYGHDPLSRYGSETVSELPTGICMVHGHFRPARYAQVSDALRLTFLRDPIENLLSIYFYWQTVPLTGNSWHSKFLSEWPTIVEFAQWSPLQCLMSETYFGGFDMSRFDFVGFNETRLSGYEKLGKMIGLPLDGTIHSNQTKGSWIGRMEMRHDPRIGPQLRSLLAKDLRFFEKQRAIWD
jgi:hypothetical protein